MYRDIIKVDRWELHCPVKNLETLPIKFVQGIKTTVFDRHQYSSLFGGVEADQRKVCDLQHLGTHIYLTSCMWLNLPGLPPSVFADYKWIRSKTGDGNSLETWLKLNPSNADTIRATATCLEYRGICILEASNVFPVCVAMCTHSCCWTLRRHVPDLSLAICQWERLTRGWYYAYQCYYHSVPQICPPLVHTIIIRIER